MILAFAIIFTFEQTASAQHGALDTTFGFMGTKTDQSSSKSMVASKIARQSDGKILAAGHMEGTGYPFDLLLLRRYNTNGSVDTGFGLSGFATEEINGQPWYIYGEATSVAQMSDGSGRIVVGGGYYSFGSNQITPAIFCFTSSGVLDTSFGDDGRVTLPGQVGTMARSVVSLAGGKTLAMIHGPARVVRLNSDGSLDPTFGVSGIAESAVEGGIIVINRKGGGIVIGGSVLLNFPTPALQYLNSNGTPSTTHGSNGFMTLSIGPACGGFVNTVSSLDTQTDGKVVLAFSCGSPGAVFNSIARIRVDDSLDLGFGSNGYIVSNVTAYGTARLRLSTKPSYNLVAYVNTGQSNANYLKSYTSSGTAYLSYSPSNYSVNDLLIQLDNKVVVLLHSPGGSIVLKRHLY